MTYEEEYAIVRALLSLRDDSRDVASRASGLAEKAIKRLQENHPEEFTKATLKVR